MGKISKALEKAGKNSHTKSLVQTEIERRVESKFASVDSFDKTDQVGNVVQSDNETKRQTDHPTPKKLQAHTAPKYSVERDAGRSMERGGGDGATLKGLPPETENTNIALVKTEKAGESKPIVRTSAERENQSYGEAYPKEPKWETGQRVNVRYSKTKVHAVDPEKLKNNKIFTIFDEIEATNQIKILRTQVLKKLNDIGGNSILVTSANPCEGKTFTSINLGVSIAKEFDRTVLIIDADLRQPTKAHTAFSEDFFSLHFEKGLTDYLLGDADISDIMINPGIDKLTFIPGGKPVFNSPELLNSNRMAEMMAEVKTRYGPKRLVIVDGPAILPFSDAIILSRYVDGVIAVVEVERTRTEDLKKMMESLKEARIIGTVLNKNRS